MAITKDQRELRKQFLGSSDIPRIMAGDRVRVVVEKLALFETKKEHEEDDADDEPDQDLPTDDLEDKIEVRIGELVEGKILDAYEQEYRPERLIRSPDTMRHPDFPWLGAHLDAEAVYDNETMINAEVKSVGWYRKRFWGKEGTDDIPPPVMWQVQHQMLVTGLPLTHVPVCFIDEESLRYLLVGKLPPIHVYVVPADSTLQGWILQRSREVWNYVEAREIPPPEKPRDLYYMYRKDNGSIVEATEQVALYHSQLLELKAELKRLTGQKNRLDFEIKSFMKEAAELWSDGRRLATWKKSADSEKLDSGRLAREHPKLFKRYLIPVDGTRRLLLKEPK